MINPASRKIIARSQAFELSSMVIVVGEVQYGFSFNSE